MHGVFSKTAVLVWQIQGESILCEICVTSFMNIPLLVFVSKNGSSKTGMKKYLPQHLNKLMRILMYVFHLELLLAKKWTFLSRFQVWQMKEQFWFYSDGLAFSCRTCLIKDEKCSFIWCLVVWWCQHRNSGIHFIKKQDFWVFIFVGMKYML